MTEEQFFKLRFPIGEFKMPDKVDAHLIQNWIDDIAHFPSQTKNMTHALNVEQLNWKYRPESWSIKQVVHHCADSHMNSMMRFKLALTEDLPTIRPYYEDRWATLADSLDDDISGALQMLEGLHKRWVKLLLSLSTDDLKRVFVHPEHGKQILLMENIAFYSWHSRHHLEHIKLALEAKGQFH